MTTERIAKALAWTIVAAILASTAALVAGIGMLARRLPDGPTPHSEEDEPSPSDEGIGEQPEERSLTDSPELEEPSDNPPSPSTEARPN